MIKALNDNVVVKVEKTFVKSSVIIPDSVQAGYFYATVTSVGMNCARAIVSCDKVVVKHEKREPFKHNEKDYYIVKSRDILLIKKKDTWYPVGNKSLLQRLNEEEITKGGIIVPACYSTQDQTLNTIFIRSGLADPFRTIESTLLPGDFVRIAKWDQMIEEIDINGKYHLIVPNPLLLYAARESLTE